MLRPIIMIGCGGAGNKVVRYTRDVVERRLKEAGWGQGVPRAWQFIGVDSHGSLDDPSIPMLPQNDFVNLATQFSDYQELETALQLRFGLQSGQPDVFKELIGWRANPRDLHVPISAGAGQYRAVGRAVGLLSLQSHLNNRIRHAFEACDASGPEIVVVSRLLGVDVQPGQPVPQPIVMVVGSIAGGTGAGIMLDVIDLVRSTHVNGAFPTLVALTPDVFGHLQNDGMAANSAAFMSELLNAYWDNQLVENGLVPPNIPAHFRGPHSVFMIGRRNLDGVDLGDMRNVYSAVGNALATITTSLQVQQDFHHFKTVDWANKAAVNAGGYGFADQYLPGVVSSFGSATISVGRGRFREYMKKLLLRSIIEQLAYGFEKAAVTTLGVAECQSMSTSEKIAKLSRLNSSDFLSETGISIEQIEEVFFSSDILKSEYYEISHAMKSSLNPMGNLRSDEWMSVISVHSRDHWISIKEEKNFQSAQKLQLWVTDVYQRALRSSAKFSAELSIPVVISMIEIARTEVLSTASELRNKSKIYREQSSRAAINGPMFFSGGRRRFAVGAAPVQETIDEISKSIVLGWSADIQEQLAAALESVATSMLTSLEAELRISHARIGSIIAPQDGRPPISEEWPKKDGPVPIAFVPSPVEFFLEDYTAWPQRARELIYQSIVNHGGLPIDPIEAASTLIIRGEFGNSSAGQSVLPLIWDEGGKAEPSWTPGKNVDIRIEDSVHGLLERIDVWLSRPSTEVNLVLNEGLSSYLNPVNPITGAPVADHLHRLETFREKLQLALMTSRPLIEIDQQLNAVVHPRPTSCSLNIGGFPFALGHQAREWTENAIQSFLGAVEPLNWAFTSAESESVSLTTFLEYPVNPSVISSITEPLAGALNRFNSEHSLQGAFWQWRRAQVLGKFIPLPRELRLAAIRGFAIARALGVMSAEEREQNVIAARDGDKQFPKLLLTPTNRNNLMPALLEAMVLAFADTPTKGPNAFDAYKSLIEYGTGQGLYGEFQVGGLLQHFLERGHYDGVRIVDPNRADSVLSSEPRERAGKVIEYLQRNIERFEDLERSGPEPRSWRNSDGSVDPTDTLTHELLPDLRNAYGQVLDAVRNWLSQPVEIV